MQSFLRGALAGLAAVAGLAVLWGAVWLVGVMFGEVAALVAGVVVFVFCFSGFLAVLLEMND